MILQYFYFWHTKSDEDLTKIFDNCWKFWLFFLQFLHFMKILDNFEFFTTLTIFTFLTIMNCWQFRQFDNFGQVWQPWRAFAILAMLIYYTLFRRIWSHNIISFFPKEHWLKITIETTSWTINLPQKQVFGCNKALKYTFFRATIATVSVPASNMLEVWFMSFVVVTADGIGSHPFKKNKLRSQLFES